MNEELDVTIEKTVFEGRALARHGRYVIFADGALPGERVRVAGVLESLSLTPDAAEALIMRARVAMGWIEADAEVEEELIEADYVEEDQSVLSVD